MSGKNSRRFLGIVLVAVLCGLAAGVLGEIVTRVYLLKDFSLPYLTSEVNLTDLNGSRSNLIIRDAKKVVVNQDVKVSETLNSLRPSLVGIFKTLSSKTPADKLAPDYYKLDEPLLVGLIITSDGWAVASLPPDKQKDFNSKNYVAIGSDRKVYSLDKIEILQDNPGDLVIFHLVGATNFTVKKIVPRTDLSVGLSLLAINGLNEARPLNISFFMKTPAILNSETINARLGLSGDLSDLKNTFVFNLAGDLVAFIDSSREIVPAFSYNSVWQNILKQKPLSRPYLGVNYLDLSNAKLLTNTLDKGALLYQTAASPAVIKNSPAALAGLKAGDIISWVDNQEIKATSDLADIIANYNSGDTVTITYFRDGQEREVELKLGALPQNK